MSKVRFVDSNITISPGGDVGGDSSISASYSVTSSYSNFAQTASLLLGSVTSASYATTSSYAEYAVSASHEIVKEVSSSYADTASYVAAGNIAQPFVNITASGNISASNSIIGSSGSFSHLQVTRGTAEVGTSNFFAIEASGADTIQRIGSTALGLAFHSDTQNTNITSNQTASLSGYETVVGALMGTNVTRSINLGVNTTIPAFNNLWNINLGGGQSDTKLFIGASTTELTGSLKVTGSADFSNATVTGIETDPFPYTGSALISGSLNLTGSLGINSGIINLSSIPTSPGANTQVNIGADSDTSVKVFKIYSNAGYVEIGPQNASYMHFYTDRPKYYFNAPLQVAGEVMSHNGEDLVLGSHGGTSDTITIGTDDIIFELNNNNIFHITTGSAGLDAIFSGSATSTSSFGHYLGDGSQLTGIETDPFPYTGSAIISGSLDITGSLGVTGNAEFTNITSSNGGRFESAGSAGEFIIKNAGNDADAFTVYMTDGTGTANIGAYGGIQFISRYGSTGTVASYNNLGTFSFNYDVNIASGKHLSGSATSTASFGTYLGDGSQLTGIETDPFPYTGSAIISGSTELIGPVNITGSTVIFSSGTPGLTIQSNNDPAEETKIYDAKIALEDSGLEQVVIKSNTSTNTMTGNISLRAATLAYGYLQATNWHSNNRISWLSSGIRLGERLSDPESSPNQTSPYVLSATGSVGFEGNTDITGSLEITGNVSGSATSTSSFGTYLGDGSQLTGIETDPFPYTGDAQITGSLLVSGSTEITDGNLTLSYPKSIKWSAANGSSYNSIDSNDTSGYYAIRYASNGGDSSGNIMHRFMTNKGASADTTVVTITRGGALSAVGAITSTDSNSKLSGSFSGSFQGDGSQLTGVSAFPFTGDAQITGSLIVSGSFLPHGNGNIDGVVIGENAAHIGTGALNTGHVAIGDTAQANMFGVAIGTSATAGVDNISIGYKAGANHGTNSRGVIAIGTEVQPTTNADNSINFSANDQNISVFSPSEPKTFGVYLGSSTADSPDLKFKVGPASASYWSGSGYFGFNTKTPDASLTVYDSGSTVFNVIGSQGTLFSVDDDLSGTLFTANDISGLPVLEASASGEVYIGKSPQSLYTTAIISSTTSSVTQSIFGLSTSSYDGAFFDYTVHSTSSARAGSIMAVWSGSDITYTETTTTDLGDTSNLNLIVHISQSQAQLSQYSDVDGYKIKTIIRSI